MVNVYVRNMDDEAYIRAKMLAARLGKTIGEVLSESVRSFIPKAKKPGLKALGTYDFGPGTENLSKEIDKYAFRD